MKINKSQILHALKGDLRAATPIQKDWLQRRETWVNETYGKAYGNEEEGKSRIVSKDIKKQMDWMIPTITDPFLSSEDVIQCNPVTFEDAEAARQNELLLNTQFTRKFPRFNFINKAVRVLATEGTVIVQTGWDYEDEEVEVETEVVAVDEFGRKFVTIQKQKQTRVLVNKPTAKVCRNEDIFIDPTCMDDFDKCQFVIHRYESDLSTLKADGRYKNLDKIQQKSAFAGYGADFIPEDISYFQFEDNPRKKLLVHEYWGNYDVDGDGIAEPIVCAWVGDVIIRLGSNPYPDKKPPFIVVPFNSVPFQLFGEALAESIGDNQKVKTAITRGLIDNMAKSNNGQVGLRRGALDMRNRKRFLEGKNFEFNGSPTDFWQGGYNQLPSSAFDMLALQNNEIESQTGTKSFSGGINGASLGSTATAARGAMDATAVRRLHLVRNISENLIKPLMRKWMAYNAEFLEEEEVVRITNEEYVPIRKDDLLGNIDIEITISTAEDNNAKAQQLGFLLQTMGPNEDPKIRRDLMADIYELNRMPDKAERIRNYQPEPDPMQVEMQRLQMEHMKAEIATMYAEIKDREARAAENQVDARVKMAKAMKEEASARKIDAETDLRNLDFVKADEQISHKEKMELEQFKRETALAQMMMQRDAGDRNIGVPN